MPSLAVDNHCCRSLREDRGDQVLDVTPLFHRMFESAGAHPTWPNASHPVPTVGLRPCRGFGTR